MPRSLSIITAAALAVCVLCAGSAAAASTRYAAPTAPPKASDCTNVADPCPLSSALEQAQAGDTVSLLVGTYDVTGTALPAIPLQWVPTDERTRPKLTSSAAAPTIALGPAQSGSSFDGVEIDKPTVMAETAGSDALQVAAGIAATISSTVIRGPVCVDAPDAGALTIDRSDLASPAGSTCARLSATSRLLRSTVGRTDGIATATPPPSVVTTGLVEDTQVGGGLELAGPDAVARRVSASGWTAIWGEGLVVDSVARAIGSEGAAIAADALGGGTLRVINATAVAAQAPALLSAPARADMGPLSPNVLQVSNSIADGTPSDIASPACATLPCERGRIEIDHSNFAVREPAAGTGLITEGAGNQSADPRFVDAGAGDLHLRAGSPAIDAGVAQARALPLDLDGHPRAQGAAIDLGAYETPAPASAGGPASGASGAVDRTAPILGRLHLRHARFRVGARATAITTTVSEAGRLSITVQRRTPGHRNDGRCVAHAPKKTAACIRWITQRPGLTRRVASAGRVTVAFDGRIGGRRLSAGRYRFVVVATDAAGNRSPGRTAAFTVVRTASSKAA